MSESRLFDIKSMIGVEMLYKVLDCISKASTQCDKQRIIDRLNFMFSNTDGDDTFILQISRAVDSLSSPYHWYQLIVWNNFFDGIFNFGTPAKTRSAKLADCFAKRERERERKRKRTLKHSKNENINEVVSSFDKGLDAIVISLLYVDWLIKSQLKIDQRNYPLENKLIAALREEASDKYETYSLRLEKMDQHHLYKQESELFEMQDELHKANEDLFDKLCNVLSVFGEDCGEIIGQYYDVIGKFCCIQKMPFDAVFDLFDRLKIYDICVSTRQKEVEEKKRDIGTSVDDRDGSDEIRSFLLEYFGKFVEKIQERASKLKLYKLLTDYKLFIDGLSNKVTGAKFYSKIGKNEDILYDPAFVAYIKPVFEEYSDEEMSKWYLQYWNMHGIKCVVDIIYQCGFKFEVFCNLLKQYPRRLRDGRICRFEEWLELIVQPSQYVPNATKLIIAANPPLKFDDIMNIKDENQKSCYLQRLKLVLVKDDAKTAQLLGFGPQLEMPLVKYKQVSICNRMLHYLLDDVIPDLSLHGQDKKILSFFAGNDGQAIIGFISELIKIVEANQKENPVRVEWLVPFYLFLFVSLCFLCHGFGVTTHYNILQVGSVLQHAVATRQSFHAYWTNLRFKLICPYQIDRQLSAIYELL